MSVFCPWAGNRSPPRSVEGLPPDILNGILQNFFKEIDKKYGKHYEPSSLAPIQSSIGRHLYESNYEYSMLNIRLFKGSRDVQEIKARFLSEK